MNHIIKLEELIEAGIPEWAAEEVIWLGEEEWLQHYETYGTISSECEAARRAMEIRGEEYECAGYDPEIDGGPMAVDRSKVCLNCMEDLQREIDYKITMLLLQKGNHDEISGSYRIA